MTKLKQVVRAKFLGYGIDYGIECGLQIQNEKLKGYFYCPLCPERKKVNLSLKKYKNGKPDAWVNSNLILHVKKFHEEDILTEDHLDGDGPEVDDASTSGAYLEVDHASEVVYETATSFVANSVVDRDIDIRNQEKSLNRPAAILNQAATSDAYDDSIIVSNKCVEKVQQYNAFGCRGGRMIQMVNEQIAGTSTSDANGSTLIAEIVSNSSVETTQQYNNFGSRGMRMVQMVNERIGEASTSDTTGDYLLTKIFSQRVVDRPPVKYNGTIGESHFLDETNSSDLAGNVTIVGGGSHRTSITSIVGTKGNGDHNASSEDLFSGY